MKDTCWKLAKRKIKVWRNSLLLKLQSLKYDHEWQEHHDLEYISDTFLTLMIRSAVFLEACKLFFFFFFYSFFRVPERVFVQDPRGSPPPKAQKCQRLLKEAHTAKHWPERREPSQFANEKTVKTVPVVAPSSSQWRERGREGKLFTSWVILYWAWLRNQRKWWKWLRASIQWFKGQFRWRYAIGLFWLFWGNVPDAAFDKRYSTKAKNTCKYKSKGKGDGVWYMYLGTYLCKLSFLYLLGLQNLLQPQIE